MKKEESSKHTQVVQEVEGLLRQAVPTLLPEEMLGGALQIWHDFAALTALGGTRKPVIWAAAVIYIYDRLYLGDLSQAETAVIFNTSAISVSQKYQQIVKCLGVTVLDPRYIPEELHEAVQSGLNLFPQGLSLMKAPRGGWYQRMLHKLLPSMSSLLEEEADSAQDLVYAGWEALDSRFTPADFDTAADYFLAALSIDPTMADALNGLGDIAEGKGDLSEAEACYRRAYELARAQLGSESPQSFAWWLDHDTRPYMRARYGLAGVYWQADRLSDALAEYEALLRLNKNDNQGVRYFIGPLQLLRGDVEAALHAYEQFAEDYPDDWDDPHHTFCWGLALYQAGRLSEAVVKWREACFANIYIAPLLLAEPLPTDDLWLFTNLDWPDYAEDYRDYYGKLWDRWPQALFCLRRLWNDLQMQTDVARWLHLGKLLGELSEARKAGSEEEAPGEWEQLIEERRGIEEHEPGVDMLRRVVDGTETTG